MGTLKIVKNAAGQVVRIEETTPSGTVGTADKVDVTNVTYETGES